MPCNKLKKADAAAPIIVDVDKKNVRMEIKKSWQHELHNILNSPRVAEMTFHVPKVDKDLEFITPGAMAGALQDYMKFPIISEFHKERPIGMAEKVWQTNTDEFKARIRIRDDPSTDDVWEKMNLPLGTAGRYDQVSIAGKRIVYSQECNIPLSMRKATNPCRTERLRLDSVSVCDDRARNDGTELNVVKALSDDQESFVYTTSLELKQVTDSLIKAETTESELIHPVTDGANQPDKTRVEDNIFNPLIHPATGNAPKGGTMKKGEKPEKKASDEEAQEPVEETEAKKGDEEKPEKEEVEKAPPKEEQKEDAKKAEDPYQEILKLLRELVASDKEVHSKLGKSEEKEEMEEEKEEKEEKCVKKAEVPPAIPSLQDTEKLVKATMEQEFQKALDAKIAPLQEKITALEAEVKKLGDEPMYKAGLLLNQLNVKGDGTIEPTNAGAVAEGIIKRKGGK